MFRPSYVHRQEDRIVPAALYEMFYMHFMQAVYQGEGCTI
jgi:hypothetical protein